MRERKTYVVLCSYDGCEKVMNIRRDRIKYHSGLCTTHSHVKRPFESIYNRLHRDWRNTQVKLSYKEFLKFTKIKECIYCGIAIDRHPFSTVNGVFSSAAYFLDKKDPAGPYSKYNCVVCCTNCNKIKNNLLTYDEMKAAMKAVLKVRNNGN